jgi:hypothetical protein
MASTVQVGTILMKDCPGMPQFIGYETEPGFGEWHRIKMPDGISLDSKIHTAGWNFFFIATVVKAMFFGSPSSAKMKNAIGRILGKVRQQNFNGLEITAIVPRSFFGLPYVSVVAHSRHLQQSSTLDSPEARRTMQNDAAWARG